MVESRGGGGVGAGGEDEEAGCWFYIRLPLRFRIWGESTPMSGRERAGVGGINHGRLSSCNLLSAAVEGS